MWGDFAQGVEPHFPTVLLGDVMICLEFVGGTRSVREWSATLIPEYQWILLY